MLVKISSLRRNHNKGFSLIELIIVIAIMVALIAVMAPQFIKYVKSSRDAVIRATAEDVLSVAKAEYTNSLLNGEGCICVSADEEGTVSITFIEGKGGENTLTYPGGVDAFSAMCGIDSNKKCASTLRCKIYVQLNDFSHVIFSEAEDNEGHQ